MAGTKVEETYPEGGFGNLGIGNWFAISGDTRSHLSDNTLCINTLPAAAGVNTEGKRQEAGGRRRFEALRAFHRKHLVIKVEFVSGAPPQTPGSLAKPERKA